MTQPLCTSGCGQPSPSALLCDSCTDKLRRDLRDVAEGLLDDLEVSYLRQARFNALRSVRSSDDAPLPWDERATATTGTAIRNAVLRWARFVVAGDPAGELLRDYLQAARRDVENAYAASRAAQARIVQRQINQTSLILPATTPAAAQLLIERLSWLRQQQDAGEAYGELHRTIGRAVRAVDCPPAQGFVGVCPGDWPEAEACGSTLYGRAGAKQHRCVECGKLWNTAELRPYFAAQAREWLATATEISRALHSLDPEEFGGIRATPERIRKWKQRGRLVVRGWIVARTTDAGDEVKHPLYRVGDVEKLLGEDADTLARRQGKQEAV